MVSISTAVFPKDEENDVGLASHYSNSTLMCSDCLWHSFITSNCYMELLYTYKILLNSRR